MIITPKIKTIIIEDNIEAQEYLTSMINRYFPEVIEILGYADSIVKSLALINKEQPDLVFMDIELTDGYSFEIFNELKNPQFEVVFVTAFENYISKAMGHFALSYIIKPINSEKLVEAVERYIRLKERLFSINKYQRFSDFIGNKEAKFLIHTGNEYINVNVDDVVKCEADGNYTQFYLIEGEKYMASKSLKYYEDLLEEKTFFKAHRSVLINTKYIKSIYKKESIILANGDTIQVSVRNKPKLSILIKSLS